MSVTLAFKADVDGVTIFEATNNAGGLRRLLSRPHAKSDFLNLSLADQKISIALALARSIAEQRADPITGETPDMEVSADAIRLSHALVADLDDDSAAALGLPPFVSHLTLEPDVSGLVGSRTFKLVCRWRSPAGPTYAERTGAILHTDRGDRRIARAMLNAFDLENLPTGAPLEEQWAAIQAFKRAIEGPSDAPLSAPDDSARMAMNSFLDKISLRAMGAFSIAPNTDVDDFEVVPFEASPSEQDVRPSEADATLTGDDLATFQKSFREKGAAPAYMLRSGDYVVPAPSLKAALDLAYQKQRAPRAERAAFVREPHRHLEEAARQALAKTIGFESEPPEAQEALIESVVSAQFVVTSEFEERVIGVVYGWTPPELPIEAEAGEVWLPEILPEAVSAAIKGLALEDAESVLETVAAELAAPGDAQNLIKIGDTETPATTHLRDALRERIDAAHKERDQEDEQEDETPKGPVMLDTRHNWTSLDWSPTWRARPCAASPETLPDGIKTELRAHQRASVEWAARAWAAGAPGVLNADEQGLGKTLQTLAFMLWLRREMLERPAADRKPFLIVAPTSLLDNWIGEISQHLAYPHFRDVTRLFGAQLGQEKMAAAAGVETDDGALRLDLSAMRRAREDGALESHVVLTTYQTMVNYHHSLSQIEFAAVVFDEIHELKNPATQKHCAARALKAEFQIGLTGTPVQNRVAELWSIMDVLAPGALRSLKDFQSEFGEATPEKMERLGQLVFSAGGADKPPLGLRRLKTAVASELPRKLRLCHPRVMPEAQIAAYDQARARAAAGGKGAMLKALQHLRAVSTHPAEATARDENGALDIDRFRSASARLDAAFDILDRIKARGERALVFVEHRKVQFLLAEMVRSRFGLASVDVLNGDTAIPKRRAIVERFQRHLKEDRGFDVLILGPKAAGVGLTLTAASHVIHISRWWNPAIEEQCNDRAHRLGQTRDVTIHTLMSVHPSLGRASFDCLLEALMRRKREVANAVLAAAGNSDEDAQSLYDRSIDAEPEPQVEISSLSDLLARVRDCSVVEIVDQPLPGRFQVRSSPADATFVVSESGLRTTRKDCDMLIYVKGDAPAPESEAPFATQIETELQQLWPDYFLGVSATHARGSDREPSPA